jgi:hypothetical protein
VAVHLDVRAQAHQLVDVHEAVLEDRLGDACRAVGDAVHGHELRLHVGREGRVLAGAKAHRLQGRPSALRTRIQAHPSRPPSICGAGLAQLVDHGVQVVGAGVPAQRHVAAGGGHRAQEGAGLDAVGMMRCGARGACSRRRPGCGCGWCRGPRCARPC